MTMNYKVIRESDYITTRWSGGTTSQIMIWPEDAIFSQRKFEWRISRATVDNGESNFTRMDGFHRELYMMTGETVLHFPQEEKEMKPGSVIRFNGESEIRSVGGGTDLNLIMKNGVDGCLEEKEFEALDTVTTQKNRGWKQCLIYIVSGQIAEKDLELTAGESIFITSDSGDETALTAKEKTKAVLFYIF